MANRDRWKLRRYHRRRGASATELAIILPLFVTIVLGCVDFGRFGYTYIAVSNAARAGAAYAMMNRPASYTSPPAGWQTSIQNAVSNEMFQENYHATSKSSNLTVTPGTPPFAVTSNGDTPTTYRFTVKATYPFTTIVTWNVSGYGIPHSFNLTQQVTMHFIRP